MSHLNSNSAFGLRKSRKLVADDRRCVVGEEHGQLPPPPKEAVQLRRRRRGEVQAETREGAKDGCGVFLGRDIEVE